MPFVFDPENIWTRPIKRRKITGSLAMARYRRLSESPEPDAPSDHSAPEKLHRRKDSFEDAEIRTSDREELIQCIKRGQRPTWVPKPNLEALCVEADAQAEARLTPSRSEDGQSQWAGPEDKPEQKPSTPATSATSIPKPRSPSALHAGDFGTTTEHAGNGMAIPRPSRLSDHSSQASYADSPPPWAAASPFSRFHRTISDPAGFDHMPAGHASRSRAPSLGSSLSSSFVMRAPTSPLVHATSNLSIDLPSSRSLGASSLHLSTTDQISPTDSGPNYTSPGLRRENTMPARNHQSRRSLTSFTYQPAPSASTVYPSRQRRLSHASETPPRQRSSMVGSFEESILRGRMSTAPSHPLEFVANIGVSGRGACPAKLKCPAHVTVPFPAVFYNYPSNPSSRTISDDSPSPYVGTINLRQYLEAPEERKTRKRSSTITSSDATLDGMDINSPVTKSESTWSGTASPKTKAAIGGAYRVPQQGQVQIILKNPENTAVKLFLVPYDLEGMLPDTKTFVRQRSFSTGPIMENLLSDKPIQDPLSSKHVLRYLIHLKFCCLGKGRFYLYDNIRVVFANRVPDGKEKLKNEIQLPEPRFTAMALSNSQPPSRRQSGVDFAQSPGSMLGSPQLDVLDGFAAGSSSLSFSPASVPFTMEHSARRHAPEPLQKENVKFQDIKLVSNGSSGSSSRPTSPEVHGFNRSSTSARGSPVPWGTAIDLQPRSPSPAFNGDGLLSKKLRELGRQAATKTSVDGDGSESGMKSRDHNGQL